jgi:hypothetical protein
MGVNTSVRSYPGSIEYRRDKTMGGGTVVPTVWQHAYYEEPMDRMKADHPIEFKLTWDKDHRAIQFPHWFAVTLLTTIALLPWSLSHRWRFTLRTLLIATTLVAIVLGLIVWAAK